MHFLRRTYPSFWSNARKDSEHYIIRGSKIEEVRFHTVSDWSLKAGSGGEKYIRKNMFSLCRIPSSMKLFIQMIVILKVWTLVGVPIKGAGGLHEIFSEIDFLVVSDREDWYLSDAFGPMKKYCS